MGSLRVKRIQVSGSAGQKSDTLGGLLHKLRVLYSGAPSGCDVTIKADGDTITTLTDNNSNTTLYPRAAITDATGTATDATTPHSVNQLSITLASGDADTVVTVEAFYYE